MAKAKPRKETCSYCHEQDHSSPCPAFQKMLADLDRANRCDEMKRRFECSHELADYVLGLEEKIELLTQRLGETQPFLEEGPGVPACNMSWATPFIEKLQQGETVKFRPHGNSMTPKIRSGQLCTVEPLGDRPPEKGEAVLCRVGRSEYLHLIHAVQGDRFQIGNNHGRINGWVGLQSIFGRLIKVEP